MAEINRTPNPPNSPIEKLITQDPLEQIRDYIRGKLSEGPVTNEELVDVLTFYDERMKYEFNKQNRIIEHWANIHTHSGVVGVSPASISREGVFWWPLDEPSGETVAHDETGNNNVGSINGGVLGAPIISARGGTSWQKTLGSQSVGLASPPTSFTGTSWTYDFLVYPTQQNTNSKETVSAKLDGGADRIYIQFEDDHLRFGQLSVGSILGTGSYPEGQIYHLMVTNDPIDSNECRLYVNGTLEITRAAATKDFYDLKHGQASTSLGAYYAEIELWDKVLTEGERFERISEVLP